MKFNKIFCLCLIFAIIMVAFVPQETEAGKKKKMLKKAALAALLLTSGKKIILPLPIPIPIPIFKQTQPVYYQQPHYGGGHYGGY